MKTTFVSLAILLNAGCGHQAFALATAKPSLPNYEVRAHLADPLDLSAGFTEAQVLDLSSPSQPVAIRSFSLCQPVDLQSSRGPMFSCREGQAGLLFNEHNGHYSVSYEDQDARFNYFFTCNTTKQDLRCTTSGRRARVIPHPAAGVSNN